MTELQVPQPGEFLRYESENSRTQVECRFVADSLWLHQAGMTELSDYQEKHRQSPDIYFSEGELDQDSVIIRPLTTAADDRNC